MDKLQAAMLAARSVTEQPAMIVRSPRPAPKPNVFVLPGLAPWRLEIRGRAVIAPPPPPRAITIRQIAELVAAEFGLTIEQIRGGYRSHNITFPRHVAQYLAQRITGQSLPVIGRYFFRDHTSVLSAVRKITRMIQANAPTRELVERLERELRQTVLD